VGSSHHHAIYILKSAGCDIVVIVSRHSIVRQSSNLTEPLRTPSSLVKIGAQQSTAKKCESKEHLTAVDAQSSQSHCPLQTSKEHLTVVNRWTSLGHSTDVHNRTSLCHRTVWSRIEQLTVVDGEAKLSHCPSSSSNRGSQHGAVGRGALRSSSTSSTLKQDVNDGSNDASVSLHSSRALQDSQARDQVPVTFFCFDTFFILLYLQHIALVFFHTVGSVRERPFVWPVEIFHQSFPEVYFLGLA